MIDPGLHFERVGVAVSHADLDEVEPHGAAVALCSKQHHEVARVWDTEVGHAAQVEVDKLAYSLEALTTGSMQIVGWR